MTDVNNNTTVVKKKRGRPRKEDVLAKQQGGRGKVGRPKGDASIVNECPHKSRNEKPSLSA